MHQKFTDSDLLETNLQDIHQLRDLITTTKKKFDFGHSLQQPSQPSFNSLSFPQSFITPLQKITSCMPTSEIKQLLLTQIQLDSRVSQAKQMLGVHLHNHNYIQMQMTFNSADRVLLQLTAQQYNPYLSSKYQSASNMLLEEAWNQASSHFEKQLHHQLVAGEVKSLEKDLFIFNEDCLTLSEFTSSINLWLGYSATFSNRDIALFFRRLAGNCQYVRKKDLQEVLCEENAYIYFDEQ